MFVLGMEVFMDMSGMASVFFQGDDYCGPAKSSDVDFEGTFFSYI